MSYFYTIVKDLKCDRESTNNHVKRRKKERNIPYSVSHSLPHIKNNTKYDNSVAVIALIFELARQY